VVPSKWGSALLHRQRAEFGGTHVPDGKRPCSIGGRQFESGSLQRGVRCELTSEGLDARAAGPGRRVHPQRHFIEAARAEILSNPQSLSRGGAEVGRLTPNSSEAKNCVRHRLPANSRPASANRRLLRSTIAEPALTRVEAPRGEFWGEAAKCMVRSRRILSRQSTGWFGYRAA